ncbi:ABC transporter substrate-binding protein [Diaminobutyricibacter sp. McL0608]|uniref:ABC transporter substrate-binding protein n=1 Tax=Leifsonia sp. McL0608 TaxID=3143537 RepID=UPI0031F2D962
MFASRRGRIAAGVLAAGALLALSACSSGNALDSGSTSSSSAGTITVGSAAFGENEIIAEIYAQALEAKGVKVNRNLNIGQRAVYLAALQDGSIDLVPEYTGNLLQNYDKSTTVQSSDDVYAALQKALPAGFEVLDQSQAQDADSYNVTKAFSDKYNVKSLADLAAVKIPLKVAANPEFATRPYGIPGLKSQYGVTSELIAVNDSGGPKTIAKLKDGEVQLADIYTTTPAIKDDGFVTLDDPKHMILAQNVVPLINSKKANTTVKDVLNKVSAALTTADLIELNSENQGAQKVSPADAAKKWLADHNLS